jgi:hypothetical protein
LLEKHGNEHKFKSKKYNFYAVGAKTTDTNFIVSKETSGFSLFSGGLYLGISSEGKAMVYNSSNQWETRFFPVSVSVVNPLLKNGSKVVFKTSRSNYFYYDKNGFPTTGNYSDDAIFTYSFDF